MTVTEFFQLPEADPILVEAPFGDIGLAGLAPLKTEGEHYVPPWRSPDGKHWWSIEGGTRRQTYKLKDEL
jgi:hypothetical protein